MTTDTFEPGAGWSEPNRRKGVIGGSIVGVGLVGATYRVMTSPPAPLLPDVVYVILATLWALELLVLWRTFLMARPLRLTFTESGMEVSFRGDRIRTVRWEAWDPTVRFVRQWAGNSASAGANVYLELSRPVHYRTPIPDEALARARAIAASKGVFEVVLPRDRLPPSAWYLPSEVVYFEGRRNHGLAGS